MRPASLLAILTFLGATLAGCSAPAPTDEGPVSYMEGTTDSDLFGRVQDEEDRGIPGAEVAIPDLSLVVETGPDGGFDFGRVDHEGEVRVVVHDERHRSTHAEVLMMEGLAARVVFTMTRLDDLEPTRTVQEFAGFIACRAHAPGAQADCPGALGEDSVDRFVLPVTVPEDEQATGLVARITWDATGPASETLQMTVDVDGMDGVEQAGDGAVEIHLGAEAAGAAVATGQVEVHVDIDPEAAGVTFAQRFSGTLVTVSEYPV